MCEERDGPDPEHAAEAFAYGMTTVRYERGYVKGWIEAAPLAPESLQMIRQHVEAVRAELERGFFVDFKQQYPQGRSGTAREAPCAGSGRLTIIVDRGT